MHSFDNAEVYADGEAEVIMGQAIKVRVCDIKQKTKPTQAARELLLRVHVHVCAWGGRGVSVCGEGVRCCMGVCFTCARVSACLPALDTHIHTNANKQSRIHTGCNGVEPRPSAPACFNNTI